MYIGISTRSRKKEELDCVNSWTEWNGTGKSNLKVWRTSFYNLMNLSKFWINLLIALASRDWRGQSGENPRDTAFVWSAVRDSMISVVAWWLGSVYSPCLYSVLTPVVRDRARWWRWLVGVNLVCYKDICQQVRSEQQGERGEAGPAHICQLVGWVIISWLVVIIVTRIFTSQLTEMRKICFQVDWKISKQKSRVVIQLVDYLCNDVWKIWHIKVVILANDNYCLIVHWVVLYRLAGREF